MNFGSHTDSVAAFAADLVNLTTPGSRQGRPYEPPTGSELRGALHETMRFGSDGAVAAPRPRAVAALVDLGQRARVVFEQVQGGRVDAAACTANALLQHYRPTPYLDHHDGEPWHLHFHGSAESDASGWGGGVAVALATVLGSAYSDRLRVCEATACDRVFVDVTRNATRRFCSTTCQNRVKAAAHRARNV